MKVATLTIMAAIALPALALAEGDSTSAGKGAASTTGAAADSSRLPQSPGVTQNAPGRRTNGTPGDSGNTGTDSGMEASDEKTSGVTAPPTSKGRAPSDNTKVDD